MTKALTAPTFPDPEQTQAARWLNALLVLTFFVVSGGLLFFFPFSFSTRGLQLTSIFVPLFLLSSIFGAWLLMRRGSYRPAAFITIAALFIIPTYLNLATKQSIVQMSGSISF
ncbi:MAG: hypothetical protein R2932_08770 [Caldilineaceae bacterium]